MVLLLPWLAGCSTLAYYQQSVVGHLRLMAKAEPIDRLLAQDDLSKSLHDRLWEVQRIRDFAVSELGLPDNDSYRSFAYIQRKAVVWSVVAAPELSLTARQWCYPIIGCASYRGYFSMEAADSYAEALHREGLDVTVEPVPAYSTLGWFDDPLPSSVIDWPTPQIAGLIFHELAHQKIYVKGDSAFNESFASALQEVGVERWLQQQGDPVQIDEWRHQQARHKRFIDLLMTSRERLETLYQSAQSTDQKREKKRLLFAALRRDYLKLKTDWDGYGGYDAWFARPVNNARLVSIATYERWIPLFRKLISTTPDMAAFYRQVNDLSRQPMEQRRREMQRQLDQ